MSMRITNSMVSRNVLMDINNTADRLNRTRSKASSNREIDRPSDDPAGAARALKLRESIDGTQQHQRNANDALSFLNAAEIGLDGITQVIQEVRDLIIQGSNDVVTPTASEALATKVRHLIEEAKHFGNATVAGRYVFGGTETTTAPYPPTAPPPAAPDVYVGNNDRISREIGPGVSVSINQPGSAVLGTGTPGDLLSVLRSIADNLQTGNRAALRSTDLVALDGRLDSILGVRADNGAITERLDAAISRLDQFEESTLGQLSDTEDADFAKVMITLNTQQTAYEAALKAGANIAQASLMDFLR